MQFDDRKDISSGMCPCEQRRRERRSESRAYAACMSGERENEQDISQPQCRLYRLRFEGARLEQRVEGRGSWVVCVCQGLGPVLFPKPPGE